jgi:FkbM family methyltransferase
MFQRLYEVASGQRKTVFPRGRGLAYKVFQFLKGWVRKDKYFIKAKIGENQILLPIYHQLAWTINYNKLYSWNLSRINSYVAKHIMDYLIIDIGANIGDSAFFLRGMDKINPIICIEGNHEYLPLLHHNANNLGGIQVIESFVRKSEEVSPGKLVSDGKGTTLIVEDAQGALIKYTSLDQILIDSSANKKVGLLKIDTDGYDCPIIKNSIEFICKHNPVIFFEYAPQCFLKGRDEHADIFHFLLSNQYYYFIFYDGAGNYLISCTENELNLVSKEMHFYFTSGYKSYGDVVVFRKNDRQLFEYSVNQEKKFYESYFDGKHI